MSVDLADDLRAGRPVTDDAFDRIYPKLLRLRSAAHWTPLDVVRAACALLAPDGERVLDIGSGVGKLCLVGALTRRGTWTGVERDPARHAAAVAARAALGLADDAPRFLAADALALADDVFGEFDAYYLFNPFAEQLLNARDVMASRASYADDIDRVTRLLARSRAGTRVVTYHGFGAGTDGLAGFELAHREDARDSELCLWLRTDRPTLFT